MPLCEDPLLPPLLSSVTSGATPSSSSSSELGTSRAMAMLKNAVLWRKEFGIKVLVEEDLGIPEMEKVVFMRGSDKEEHPVCYNVYGEFQNKELYAAAFANEEKGIGKLLDFKLGGVSTMVQVTDLKNLISLVKKELRQALDHFLRREPKAREFGHHS